MAIIIKTTGKAIPKKIMHNSDFPASLDTSDEWIRSHTGIGSRYIASQEDTSASLGAEACKQVLANENLNPQDIDLIICATATAEYQGFPSNALSKKNWVQKMRHVLTCLQHVQAFYTQ